MENHQLKADYKKALELGQILVAYARVAMIGPGGIGKTSFLSGLKNQPLPQANSTQLAVTSTVQPQKWNKVIENPESPWTEVTEEDETNELVGLVQLVKNVTSGKTQSSRFVKLIQVASAIAGAASPKKAASLEYQNEVSKTVDQILSRAVRTAQQNPDAQASDSEVMLHVWDCGGQPVFLDVLPPFLTSKTMFMLMFDASKSLYDECIATSHQNGAVAGSEKYHGTTTIELLLQWMASVYATLTKQGTGDCQTLFPRILPIGTHGDHPSVVSRKEEILKEISSQCEGKVFAHVVRPGVIVDNTTAGKGDDEDPAFKQVRKETYTFADENLKIPTPITWVLFRKVFKQVAVKNPIISVEEATKIAKACGIDEKSFHSVLHFYHELAVFLHYDQIPSLKKWIIADIQWLINHLAKILALEGFEESRGSLLWKPLREKGILLQRLCEEVWQGSKLPAGSILDLMQHFLLLAPIHSKVYPQHPGQEYFIPSVLKPFKPSHDTLTLTTSLQQAAPLHLVYSTLYVPPGFFTRLATILTKETKCQVLFREDVYRNRISILYGEANHQIDTIILSQLSSSVKIEVMRTQGRLSHHLPFSSVCREILKLIQECSISILEWLPGVTVSPAFVCEQCSNSDTQAQSQTFVQFQPDATTRSFLRCEKKHTANPSKTQLHWMKVSPKEEGICGSLLSPAELKSLAKEVPQDKVKELVENLEMTPHLTSGNHSHLETVLIRWEKEMKKLEVPHRRSYLVYFLRATGLQDLAERLKYGELLENVALTQEEEVSSVSQEPLTAAELLKCSRFMGSLHGHEASDLYLLAGILDISDKELKSISSRFKNPQSQAYQLLCTWHSKTRSQHTARETLISALTEANFSFAAQSLKQPSLDNLLKYVKTAKWNRLGVFLEIDPVRLDMINEDTNRTEDKLCQMFKTWLVTETGPTWNKVVKALEDMELKVLASDIKDKFC